MASRHSTLRPPFPVPRTVTAALDGQQVAAHEAVYTRIGAGSGTGHGVFSRLSVV
jgi:hypothetical protein